MITDYLLETTYSSLVSIKTTKNLSFGYVEDSVLLAIFVVDSKSEMVYYTNLFKTNSSVDYTASINDFNTNYKATATVYTDFEAGVAAEYSKLVYDFKGNILRASSEFNITTRTETDVANTSYTVPTGKNFYLTFFGASLESPVLCKFRLKVGTATKFRIVLGMDSANRMEVSAGILIATGGETIKITYESNIAKGTAWAGFAGVEI